MPSFEVIVGASVAYGLVTLCGLYGLPYLPYELLMLSDEYGLPQRPYTFEVEFGSYLFALSLHPAID